MLAHVSAQNRCLPQRSYCLLEKLANVSETIGMVLKSSSTPIR